MEESESQPEVISDPEATLNEKLTFVTGAWVKSEAGRARNARIAQTLALGLVLALIVAGVSLYGWGSTSSSLANRNKAVQTLTEQGLTRGKIDACQATAFARAFDAVTITETYKAGDLVRAYTACNRKYGG